MYHCDGLPQQGTFPDDRCWKDTSGEAQGGEDHCGTQSLALNYLVLVIAGLERANSSGSGMSYNGLEAVGEHRELGASPGGGWGNAMKILGEMERDMADAPTGELSDRCAAADSFSEWALTVPYKAFMAFSLWEVRTAILVSEGRHSTRCLAADLSSRCALTGPWKAFLYQFCQKSGGFSWRGADPVCCQNFVTLFFVCMLLDWLLVPPSVHQNAAYHFHGFPVQDGEEDS